MQGKATQGESTQTESTQGRTTRGNTTRGRLIQIKSTQGNTTRGNTMQGNTMQVESLQGKRTGWLAVAIASLAVIGACAGAEQTEDTPEIRESIARKIAKLEIESGDLEQRLDRGADLARAYSLDTLRLELGRELTDEEMTDVRGIMRAVLGEFLTTERWEDILTQVYTAHFSSSELQTILEFFESPAGAKVLRLSPQLAREIDDRTDAIFETELGEFVDRVDEELARAFPVLREGES